MKIMFKIGPILKTTAAITVFAFTLTSVVPAGWAGPDQRADTLRGSIEGVEAGLEERLLREGQEPDTEAVTAPVSSGIQPTLWDRRDFLKGTGAAAVGAAVLSVISPTQAPAQTQTPPPEPPVVPAVPPDMVIPNLVEMDASNGRTTLPLPRKVYLPEALKNPDTITEALGKEWVALKRDLSKIGALQWLDGTPDETQAASWQPRRFGPSDEQLQEMKKKEPSKRRQVTVSAYVRSPRRMDDADPDKADKIWGAAGRSMRTAAGYTGAEKPPMGSTRIYAGAHELMQGNQPDNAVAWLARQKALERHGTLLIPVYGDPTPAESKWGPTSLSESHGASELVDQWAIQMEHQLLLTPAPHDGVFRLALNIEPYKLPRYQETLIEYENAKAAYEAAVAAKDEAAQAKAEETIQETGRQLAVYWQNIFRNDDHDPGLVLRLKKKLTTMLQRQTKRTYEDVEITVFVPNWFDEVVAEMEKVGRPISIPPSTRLMVMNYRNQGDEAKKALSGVRNLVRPANKKRAGGALAGAKYGVGVEMGPLPEEALKAGNASFYESEERLTEVGAALAGDLSGDETFTQEYLLSFPDEYLFSKWLIHGGLTPEERAVHKAMRADLELKLTAALAYLLGVGRKERSVFNELPPDIDTNEAARLMAEHLVQRVVSGAFAGGFGRAVVLTPYRTLRASFTYKKLIPILDLDLFILGPDLGIVYALYLESWSGLLGDQLKITSLKLVVVDPSKKGKVTLRDHTGAVIDTVDGKLFLPETELIVNGGNPRGDLRAMVTPSSGFDYYFLMKVEVPAVGANGKKNKVIRGLPQLRLYAGKGDPVFAEAEGMEIQPGESKTTVVRLLVNPAVRDRQDPNQRPGVIQAMSRVGLAAVFLSTTRGAGEALPFLDVVGLPGYESGPLSRALRSDLRREELTQQVQARITTHQMNPIAAEAILREETAVFLPLPEGEDPAPAIAKIADRRDHHGVTTLCCEAAALTPLIRKFQAERTGAGKPIQTTQDLFDLVNAVLRDPAAAARLRQVRTLLASARERGLKVVFVADAKQLAENRFFSSVIDQADYFLVLSILMELTAFGMDTSSGLAIRNPEALLPAARAQIVELLQDGEAPLFFLGAGSQSVRSNGLSVPQIYDATGKATTEDLVRALVSDRKKGRGGTRVLAGPAMISLEQMDRAETGGVLADAGVLTQNIVDAALDPEWLDRLIRQPYSYLTEPHRLAPDFLRTRTLTPLVTGVLHPIAQSWSPRDDRNARLVIRLRGVRIGDPEQAVLRTSTLPGVPGWVDYQNGVRIILRNLLSGPYMRQMELIGVQAPAPPGEEGLNLVPLAVVDRHRENLDRFPVIPLNIGPAEQQFTTWVELGTEEVGITRDPEDGSRLFLIGEKVLHVRTDGEGNLIFQVEGYPEEKPIPRPSSNQSVYRDVPEQQIGHPSVGIELEGEFGLVTLHLGDHSAQLWEISQLKGWSKRDASFEVERGNLTVEWGGEKEPPVRRDLPRLAVDPRDNSVALYPEPWETPARLLIRYGLPAGLAVAAARWSQRVVSVARLEQSRSRAAREGQMSPLPPKSVSFGGRLWNLGWTLGVISLVLLVLNVPPLGPVLTPLLLSSQWTGWPLAAKLAVGLPILGKFVVDGLGGLVPEAQDLSPWPLRVLGKLFSGMKGLFKVVQVGLFGGVAAYGAFKGLTLLLTGLAQPVTSPAGMYILGAGAVLYGLLKLINWSRRGAEPEQVRQDARRTRGPILPGEALISYAVTAAVLALLFGVPALGAVTVGKVFSLLAFAWVTRMIGGILGMTFRIEDRGNNDPGFFQMLTNRPSIRWLTGGPRGPSAPVGRTIDTVLRVTLWPVAAAGLIWAVASGSVLPAAGSSGGWFFRLLSGPFGERFGLNAIRFFGSHQFQFWAGAVAAGGLAVGGAFALVRRVVEPVARGVGRLFGLRDPVHQPVSEWVEQLQDESRQGILTAPGGPFGGDALRFAASPAGQAALHAAGFNQLADLQKYGQPLQLEQVRNAFTRWRVETQGQPAMTNSGLGQGRARRILNAVRRAVGLPAQAGLEEPRLSTSEQRVLKSQWVLEQARADANQFVQENRAHLKFSAGGNPPADLQEWIQQATAAGDVAVRTVEDVVNFYAFRRQVAQYLIQLDVGARLKRGPLNWDFQEMVDYLKRHPQFHAVMPRIVVEPNPTPAILPRGIGMGMVSPNWISQALQYQIAGAGWRPLRFFEDPQNVVNLVWGMLESGMEPDIENMLGHQLPRWGVGHKFIEMLAYMGITFHLDPNALRPAEYRRLFGGLRNLILARLNRGSPESVAAGYRAALEPPYPKNIQYGTGQRPSFSFIHRLPWNDDDSTALEQDQLGSDTWAVRLLGNRNSVQIYAPVSVRIRNGQVEVADTPARYAAHFSLPGWQPELVSPTKAYRMALALSIIERNQNVQPTILTSNGVLQAVRWTSVTTTDEFAPEITAAARERVEAIERSERHEELDLYQMITDVTWADGSRHRPDEVPPPGMQVIGPVSLGRDGYASRTGRWWQQPMFLAADIITGAKWRYRNRFMESLYNLSPPFWMGITAAVLVTAGIVPTSLAATAAIWIPLLLSRHLLGPLLRNMHPVAMWRYRRTALSSGYGRSYDGQKVHDLVGLGTGADLQVLPEQLTVSGNVLHPQTDYAALVAAGAQLLRTHNLMESAENLALTFTGRDFQQDPQRRPREWERMHATALRRAIRRSNIRPGSGEFTAIQYALLELINGTHQVIGNVFAATLPMGTTDPNSLRSEDAYPFDRAEMDFETLALAMNVRGGDPYRSQMAAAGTSVEGTRSWLFISRAARELAHAVQMDPNPRAAFQRYLVALNQGPPAQQTGMEESEIHNVLDAYLAYAQNERRAGRVPGPGADFFAATSVLPPSADDVIRASGLREGDVIRAGMGAARVALSPDARFAGQVRMGDDPARLPVLDRALYEVAHFLDNPRSTSSLASAGRALDKSAGFLGSLGAAGGMHTLTEMALDNFGMDNPVSWWISAALWGYVGIDAALRALGGRREDLWITGEKYGEGVRAISRVPGALWWLAMKNPLPFPLPSVKSWLTYANQNLPGVLGLHHLRSRIDVPWSSDLLALSAHWGLPPDAFLGYVSGNQYPFLVGTAFAPGKQWGRAHLTDVIATPWEANAVPMIARRWLSRMHSHTRRLSALNYLPSDAWDMGRALAEDTLFGWIMAYMTVLEPMTPAVSVHRINYLLSRVEDQRFGQEALQQGFQFSYGMDLANALEQLKTAGGPVSGLTEQSPLEDRLNAFAARLWALRAFKADEVDTGSRTGAGQISYLFFNYTLDRLFPKLLQVFAPGQIEALKTFLAYQTVDQMLGGALARQIFQMNHDLPGNPLAGETFPPGGTLADPAVRDLLLRGWFIDPLGAYAAVKAQMHDEMVRLAGSPEGLRNAAFEAARELKAHEIGPAGGAGWGGRARRLLDGSWDDVEAGHAQQNYQAFLNTRYGGWLRQAATDFRPMPNAGGIYDLKNLQVRTIGGLWGKYRLGPTDDFRQLRQYNDLLRRDGYGDDQGRLPMIFLSDAASALTRDIERFPLGGSPARENDWGPARPGPVPAAAVFTPAPAPAAQTAGLEEPHFRGQETLQAGEPEQLTQDLFAGGLTLDQLNRYLPDVMRKVNGDAAAPEGAGVAQVPLEDYSTVQTVDITQKGLSEPMLQRGLAKMGKTAALIQVGGGGTRFDGGVPKEFREQWTGQGKRMLSKPTAANGILELATLIQILQSLNAVAAEAGVRLPVFLNESGDTREQIIQWLRFTQEKWGMDFPHLDIRLTDQLEHPTFDAETGEILWQVDASGQPQLRTMGAGTLGGVIAMDAKVRGPEGNLQEETPDALTSDKEHFLVIYADDPVLHDRDFILGLLAAGEDADIVPVGLPRRPVLDELGEPKVDSNQRVQFSPPGGRLVTAGGITQIVELSDSISESDKVPHPKLNTFEDGVYRRTGRGLTFNVGSLYLSRKGLEAYRTLYREGKFPPNVTEKKLLRLNERTGAGAVAPNLRMAYLVELYLTDGAELAAAEFPDLRVKVAEVDGWRYQAAKDFGRMKAAETILLELGQEQLLELGGEIADTSRVQFAPEWDDPTFGGLLGTRIQVAGNLGVVFEADRVLVRHLHLSSFTIEMEATEDEKTPEGRRKGSFEARVLGLQQSLLDARGFSQDPKRPGLVESLLEPAEEGKVLGLLGVPLDRSKLHDPSLVRKTQPPVFNRDSDPDQAVIQVVLLHPEGDPVELFKAQPGQQVVVPPGTVFDERVFDTAYVAQSGMASSQTASTDLVGISRALVAQQQAAGLFTSVLGTPEKVLGNDRYLLINRPDTVSSAISAAAASTQRPDPLGVPQWKPAEQGYRWRTSILKANRSPRQDGDVVLSALRQRPQGMTEPMLRDLVVFTGGAENDPAISETIWLLEQLEQLKGQLSMQGINLAVQGPGALRGFYNDAGVGASIPEHAHTQATPHPMKAEGEALDPIARVGDVTFSFIQGWAGPIFAVRSDRTTIYVAPRLILAPPPVAQDLDGYLAKDRAERDQSGEYLLGAAAREMLGTMIAMDDSTFDRLTVEAADQIVAGSLVSREALEPVVQVIRSRAQVTSGVEEETRTLQGSDVSGPIFMDLKGVPQTVFRHRISTSTVIPAVASGTRLLLTQEGVLPSAVIEQFARRGWAVETLSAEATPERLAGEVRAGLREWSGSVLVVAATELKEAVGFLPIEARLTTVFVDREMVSGMAPNVLLAFLVQSLEAFPGGIRQLESVTQTGADEFQATASQV